MAPRDIQHRSTPGWPNTCPISRRSGSTPTPSCSSLETTVGVFRAAKATSSATGVGVPLIVYIPPKWQHLTTLPIGVPTSRLVGFEDFAATVLSLAGLDTPSYMTGQAFLGSKAAPPRTVRVFVPQQLRAVASSPPGRSSMGAFTMCARTCRSRRRLRRTSYQWQMPGERAYFDAYAKNQLSARTSRVLRGAAHRGSLRFAD